MNNVSIANTVGAISALLALVGATGISPQDLQGFFVVSGAIVSFGSFIWSHIAHRQVVGAIKREAQLRGVTL